MQEIRRKLIQISSFIALEGFFFSLSPQDLNNFNLIISVTMLIHVCLTICALYELYVICARGIGDLKMFFLH